MFFFSLFFHYSNDYLQAYYDADNDNNDNQHRQHHQ